MPPSDTWDKVRHPINLSDRWDQGGYEIQNQLHSIPSSENRNYRQEKLQHSVTPADAAAAASKLLVSTAPWDASIMHGVVASAVHVLKNEGGFSPGT